MSLEIKPINSKNTWEEFISHHSPISLFQSWHWGEVIKKIKNEKLKIKNNFWRIGLYHNNSLVGIAQVEKVEAKKGSFFHIRHGPILSSWKKEYFDYLLFFLKEQAKKEHIFFLRISPLLENSSTNRDFFREYGFIPSPLHAMDGEYVWVIDLNKSEEELLSNMRKTTRYLIRQAQKLGVEIVRSKNTPDIDEFISLYEETSARHHFVKHKGIKEEYRIFLKNDEITLFKGYYQKKLLSAALIIFYNHQAIYHHSASYKQNIPINYLLQWEVIKEAKRKAKTVYNMWGIAPLGKERHPWKNLSLFKTGFGGRVVEYLHAQDLPLSPFYTLTYAGELIRKYKKGY